MDGNRARALLGVPPHASNHDVDRAFRGAVLAAHPDRGGDPARFRDLVAAREALARTTGGPSAPAALPAGPRVAHPYRSRTEAPAPRWSTLDIPRPTPVAAPVGDRTDGGFADVLAQLLAA